MKVVKALEQKYRNHLTSEIGKIANPSGKYTDEQYKKLLKTTWFKKSIRYENMRPDEKS